MQDFVSPTQIFQRPTIPAIEFRWRRELFEPSRLMEPADSDAQDSGGRFCSNKIHF
jgi:hypothetical protein